MKRVLKVAGVCAAVIALIAFIYICFVDTSFATEVTLRYHDRNTKIDVTITDKDDIRILKDLLSGLSWYDDGYPSCGFTLDTSITFSDGERSVTLCPACDMCGSARVGESNWYILINKKALIAVVEKYGMVFPCV